MLPETERLFDIMFEKSFKYQPDTPFTLRSGKVSPLYFDCRATLLDSEGLSLTGYVFSQMVRRLFPGVHFIGGLTMGADPISYATTLSHLDAASPIDPIVIRKEIKEHGTKKRIEGNIEPDATVVIVDDVITTGGSTISAITAAREVGLRVVGVIVLVDRQEFDGKKNIEELSVPVHSIFIAKQFINKDAGSVIPTIDNGGD